MKTRLTSLFTTIALILGCGSAIALLQQPRLQELTDTTAVLSSEALERQTSQESLRLAFWRKMPTLGFQNLVADWAFLSFLQYFGDTEVRKQTSYALSPDYLDVVLQKDPHFWDAYLFLSISTTLYTGQPELTIEIMDRHLPKISPKAPDRAYFIWRWRAVDELLFLGDAEAAGRSHQIAATWAAQYDTEEGQAVARASQATANFLATNPDSKIVQFSSWMTVFNNAFDETTRQLAIENIRALGGDVILNENGEIVEVKPPQE